VTEASGVGFAPRPAGRPDAVPDRLDRPFLDPLFDRLFPRLASGVEWGLDRMHAALAELGDPHLAVPAIHVGGTNGKGSVSATMAAVLARGGHRVGLYTSPHLCSLTERFQVDGRPVSEARLLQAGDRVRPVVEAHGLTFFEAATVLAFDLFRAEGCEVNVLEVGLGGRLDATNVITPLVSVLTNVDMDHAEFLGDTRTLIATEKAGILKPGVPAATAEAGPEALPVFRARARELEAPLSCIDPARDVRDVEVARDHTSFTVTTPLWGEQRFTTPLVGEHQAWNAALAVLALQLLPEPFRPGLEQVHDGVSHVVWPGRDQLRRVGDGLWLLDVAHNTAGVQSLTRVLDQLSLPHPVVALVGVLGDKDWEHMLPPLLTRVDQAFLTQPPSAPAARRWDPVEAAERVREASSRVPGGVTVVPDFADALARAGEAAAGGTVVVTGSCHTVGDALVALHMEPFREGDEGRAELPGRSGA
jgi:dihydrofolate synthase/folylpolyglutamate synthase